ncbi:MAG TPA: hypothetical protein PKC28_05325 [Bdellovibrionales bacterium]|nr:hypothetical protein [Bdellovibrionales bacterium]
MSEKTLVNKQQRREELRRELSAQLVSPARVAPPPGLSTRWPKLDRYLLWQGLPKSALTLLVSEAGGATTLWQQSAGSVTKNGQWAAWIGDRQASFTPWSLRHRGVVLSRLLMVSPPSDEKQLLWAMQELMSLCLFELIGCDLGPLTLREHQLLKLKKLAMRYQTAVVFVSRQPRILKSSSYALVLHFLKEQVHVERALHRPTPHTFERRDLYADTLPLLATGRRALCG